MTNFQNSNPFDTEEREDGESEGDKTTATLEYIREFYSSASPTTPIRAETNDRYHFGRRGFY